MTQQTIAAAIDHEERTPEESDVCDAVLQTYADGEMRCTRAPHSDMTDGTAGIHVAGAIDGIGGQTDIIAMWED